MFECHRNRRRTVHRRPDHYHVCGSSAREKMAAFAALAIVQNISFRTMCADARLRCLASELCQI